MPDLKNYTVTLLGNATLTLPRFQFSGQVVDSCDGHLIKDFTGANALVFPTLIKDLTTAQRQDLAHAVEGWIIQNLVLGG